mgnify:CR=1 FL=1
MSTVAVDTIQTLAGIEQARLVQMKTLTHSTLSTTTATFPMDTSIPLIGEGEALTSLEITPTNTANTLIIDWICPVVANSAGGRDSFVLFDNSDTAVQFCWGEQLDASYVYYVGMRHIQVGSLGTSALTWKIRFGTSTGTLQMGFISGLTWADISHATFTIMEIRA